MYSELAELCSLKWSLLFREILVDFLENLVEVVALVELSIIYSKIIIRVFLESEKDDYKAFPASIYFEPA